MHLATLAIDTDIEFNGNAGMRNLATPGPLGLLALLGVYVSLWLLLTPYAGLSHDAQAYAFQALARFDPTVLGQDVFLRFQSQDRFTVFPTLYGLAIGELGLETAAATLTLACHALWYALAFVIARRFFGTAWALIGIGLLVALPGPYGGQKVFHIAEPFLTARLPAEVLSLGGIALWLYGHRAGAGIALLAGLLVHPLMTFPALLVCGTLEVERRWDRPWTVPVTAAIFGLGAIVGSLVLGRTASLVSDAWLDAARTRSGFLFLSEWQAADWNHTVMTLGTLVFASVALPAGAARRVVLAVLWMAVLGLLLAALASEALHLRLLLQGQPWRWVWLGRVLAFLVLPAACYSAWHVGKAGRASALILVAAWLVVVPVMSRSVAPVVMGAVLTVGAVGVYALRRQLPATTETLLWRGAWALVGLVLVSALITTSLRSVILQHDAGVPLATERLMSVLALGAPALLLVLGSWALVGWQRFRRIGAVVVTIVAAAIFVPAISFAVPRWTEQAYAGEPCARFAGWRAAIPREAEVFWWDGLREVWFLLQRRSYLTLSQGGGVIFSAETTSELRRRAANAAPFIDPGYWFNEPSARYARPRPLTAEVLRALCRDPALGFVVSSDDLGLGAPRQQWPTVGRDVYLYSCSDFAARTAGT
jgi:hypothetical protein